MADDVGAGGGTGMGSPTIKQKEKAFNEARDRQAERLQSSGSPSTTKSANDPLVYLGQNDRIMGEMRFTAGTKYYDKTATLTEVAGQYYDWDSKTKNKFLTQLGLAGYDTNGMKDSQVASLWADYSQQAAAYYANKRKLTPWDILALDMKQREAYMSTPRSVTQTSKSYDMSSRGDAHAIFLTAAQQLVGRDPTKAEISAFQKALNAYEKENPTVTKTTTNYMGDDVTGQTSTTSGGVKDATRQIMAMEDVKADPEYGAYQAATTYFDAMMEMIGG